MEDPKTERYCSSASSTTTDDDDQQSFFERRTKKDRKSSSSRRLTIEEAIKTNPGSHFIDYNPFQSGTTSSRTQEVEKLRNQRRKTVDGPYSCYSHSHNHAPFNDSVQSARVVSTRPPVLRKTSIPRRSLTQQFCAFDPFTSTRNDQTQSLRNSSPPSIPSTKNEAQPVDKKRSDRRMTMVDRVLESKKNNSSLLVDWNPFQGGNPSPLTSQQRLHRRQTVDPVTDHAPAAIMTDSHTVRTTKIHGRRDRSKWGSDTTGPGEKPSTKNIGSEATIIPGLTDHKKPHHRLSLHDPALLEIKPCSVIQAEQSHHVTPQGGRKSQSNSHRQPSINQQCSIPPSSTHKITREHRDGLLIKQEELSVPDHHSKNVRTSRASFPQSKSTDSKSLMIFPGTYPYPSQPITTEVYDSLSSGAPVNLDLKRLEYSSIPSKYYPSLPPLL
ncbi:hypothetical protein Pst134EA_013140 [Puccinia striiformis f. sp. tritici]|uniref:hypothetical protein n=1 Tax=Puccinia striiformis f. sp. tritici TaxID=168172 RepID=UPI002007ECAF|nr:hypothetical protein Pst134EA_013140 [Puccinia striiformis f. sp. tritici]KAH9465249.1 hypothetical protein Pst134EA_013140 [Puccinia striiformis f. sp. tritici]